MEHVPQPASDVVMRRKPVCPLCGADAPLPIAYEPFGPDGEEAARAGEVIWGRRTVTGDDPEWHCRKCGYEWKVNEEQA